MRCENCGKQDLWVVHFETVGSTVFAFCRHCEHKRWTSGEEVLDLDSVLATASAIRPASSRR